MRRLYQARLWAILFEGEVGPGVVIVPQVGRQKPPEVVFTQDNDVNEAVASDWADDPLSKSVLPG